MKQTCETCAVLREEVGFLRRQVERLMGMTTNAPRAGAAAPAEGFTDEHGESWVRVGGQDMRLAEYQKVVAGEGIINHDGAFVPREEAQRALSMLDAALSGRPAS